MTQFLATLLLFSIDSTPENGKTILFVGDSITQAGDYVADVEAYLLACRPSDYFRVINVGKSSETVSGTSEPDHHPPRPCIHDRFARDVAAFKPNIVVACYGMNDGNYFPFDEARFEKYKSGMTRFIERVFKETPARALVLLTPPVFDASKAPPPPEDGKSFGYKHPSRDYDSVLRKYSDWLMTLKSDRVTVVDVHRAFSVYLHEATSYIWLSPDAVHPDIRGHLIIAQSLLCEWQIRPQWKELTLDVAKSPNSLTKEIIPDGSGLEKRTWKTPPYTQPLATLIPLSLPLRRQVSKGLIAEELFDQRIRITGFPAGRYDVFAFDGVFRGVTKKELGDGVELLSRDRDLRKIEQLFRDKGRIPDVPTSPRGLADIVSKRRKQISNAWLAAQKDKPFSDLKLSVDSVAKAEDEAKELAAAIDEARKPRSFEVLITPRLLP